MTRSSDTKPTRRLTRGKYNDFVVEVRERTIAFRPPRARRGGPAEVEIAVGALYQRLLLQARH